MSDKDDILNTDETPEEDLGETKILSDDALFGGADDGQEDSPEIQEEPEYNNAPDMPEENFAPEAGAAPVRAARPANRPVRKKKKKKKKKKMSRLPGVLILITLIFGISIISSIIIIGFGKDMLGIGKSENTRVIVVPEAADTEQIAAMLESDGIIRSAKAFKVFTDFRKDELVYVVGEHFVRPNMPYETILDELTKTPTEEMGDTIQITFPEGTTLIEAAFKLEEQDICDAEEFIFYFNSGGFGLSFEELLPSDSSIKFQRMEGYLFPDTYFFYEHSTPEEVCQKIYYNFEQKIDDERRARMKELNLTLDQLITFASIVQKEAGRPADMNDVASVFWNRLNDADTFPLLQSDPTSNYAKDVIRPNMQVFDQTIVDAYDTYKSPGLPPGPICNPGIDAIDAVLMNKKTNYYYFIANINTKITYFAADLEAHEANQAMIDEQYAEEKAKAAENG